MNLLITGIHGFLGSNLLQALSPAYTLNGLDIVSYQKAGLVHTYTWDELNGLPIVDVIIHLAGKSHDTKNLTKTQSYVEINTGLTQKIFDCFLKSTANKFIFFSSVKAAADTADGILTEDVVPNPIGPYGESKLAAENYILSHLPDEKQVYILRPCMIHGPGNKGNLNLLYKMVQIGIPWPLGKFNNQRSFCSIDNLTFVVQQLIEKNIPSGIYNLADDQPLSTTQLVALMAESLNKKANSWNIDTRLINQLAKAGDLLHLPLNTERLTKLTESYLVSNQKLKDTLGIQKLPMNAIDGMKKTLKSLREIL